MTLYRYLSQHSSLFEPRFLAHFRSCLTISRVSPTDGSTSMSRVGAVLLAAQSNASFVIRSSSQAQALLPTKRSIVGTFV